MREVYAQPSTILTTTQAPDSEMSAVKVTRGFDLPQKDAGRLNVTPRSQSPASGRGTPVAMQVEHGDQRKQRDNAVAHYKKQRGGAKEHLYMVVIGHVDAGKSTLMGHLLCKLGQVSEKMFLRLIFSMVWFSFFSQCERKRLFLSFCYWKIHSL